VKSGLQLVNASFIWTEPHSRRLKVRVVVRKHISELPNGGATLQGQVIVEIVIKTRQCNICAAENSTGGGEPWRVVVQLRQRVDHKKTLLLLEQEAIGAGVTDKCLGIEQMKDGLDLYFLDMPTATKFCDWAKSKVPMRSKLSKKLVSTDVRSNLNHYKHTMVLEIVPLCRDDLVYVQRQSSLRSRLPGLHLVTKVASVLRLVQVYPPSFRTIELTAEQFFRAPFTALMSADDLTPFTLLDDGTLEGQSVVHDPSNTELSDKEAEAVEEDDVSVSSIVGSASRSTEHGTELGGSDVSVARSRDVGLVSFACHTHLVGPRLGNSGDVCLGYDLEAKNLGEDFLNALSDYPNVVLVRREKLKGGVSKSNFGANPDSGGDLVGSEKVKLSSKEKRKLKREAKRA